MRCAIIENAKVVNIAEADADFAAAMGWTVSDVAAIGDDYENGEFIKSPIDPVIPAVPQQVSIRQARLALLDAGLLDDVEAIITTAGRSAQIEWEYAATVDRNHPVIAIVQQQQDMTDSQIDALFIEAAKL